MGNGIIFPRLLRDGAIIQRNKQIHIWGFTFSDEPVEVFFDKKNVKTKADSKGRFDAYLEAMEAGGPYTLSAKNSRGDLVCSENIMLGDVFYMSGQSNMEFPMSRVKDTFKEEWNGERYENLRIFKIIENRRFDGPLEELETGEWNIIGSSAIDTLPAIGFFLSKYIYSHTNVAVGVINVSLGGTPIEAWMSKEMLEGYSDRLHEASLYENDAYVEEKISENDRINELWRQKLDEEDIGLSEKWFMGHANEDWKDISLPNFLGEDFDDFFGSVWLKKDFIVDNPADFKDSVLWLGTLVDSDVTYINGVEVGKTEYCYPPRRYNIAESLLKRGKNTVCIRLRIEHNVSRVTPNKLLAVLSGDYKRVIKENKECVEGEYNMISLDGNWKYKIGAQMEMREPVTFVSYKPTGLYNGMVAPCFNYPVAAIIWYQGESNTDKSVDDYLELSRRFVSAYRKNYGDENLPYLYVRLPIFDLNKYESYPVNEQFDGWKLMRGIQEKIQATITNAYMVDVDEYGEAYDLHPQHKKGVAYRIAQTILEEGIVH